MNINEVPFILELTDEQRALLLQIVLAVELNGKYETVVFTIDRLKPIVDQLKGD